MNDSNENRTIRKDGTRRTRRKNKSNKKKVNNNNPIIETSRTPPNKKKFTQMRVDSFVREIAEEAYEHYFALEQVQLPETLTRIGARAFEGCYNLKHVQFVSDDSSPEESPSINGNLEDGLIVFPEWVILQIDSEAFSYCKSLRKVIVCSVSTTLGDGAFSNCNGLVSVELPEGLQVIETSLFWQCELLTTVNIPSTVIKIGDSAFSGCRSLTSVDLPDGLLEIGELSFLRCGSIVAFHIPPTVSSIGKKAFADCSEVKLIQLPPTLERIEQFLCCGCSSLEYIDIPPTVTVIEDRAFFGCSSLLNTRIPPSVDSIEPCAFIGCSSLISIELPKGLKFNMDISECTSLVNMAGPIWNRLSTEVSTDFLQRWKLGSVVDGYDDLARKLKNRFENSPLNGLCYYQSYHSSEDAMVQLRSLIDEDPIAATRQVDEFGMTPLHVLSLSQTPNLDMMRALIQIGHPDHIVQYMDSFGSTPMDYLCLNRLPNSTEVIRRVLQIRFDYSLGSKSLWKSDAMCQAVDKALAVDLSTRRSAIGRVYFDIVNYEWNEVLSILELFLWKVKIDEFGLKKKEQITDRQSCRINCGASVVIPHVITFLTKLDAEDYFIHTPP
eukprot:scaffold7572_cov118-Cylindrotheca_fusiformis.AAC.5